MQSSKEQQGEIRKPSSMIKTKTEENNRVGKTRDLFKKLRNTRGTENEGQRSLVLQLKPSTPK